MKETMIDGYFLAGNGDQQFTLEEAVQWGGASGYQIHGSPIVFNGRIIQPMIQYYSEEEEGKERKIVDCFHVDAFSMINVDFIEKSTLELNDGWETIYKDNSKLKMVKYES